MASERKDDPATYPALGRWMSWVDRPGNPTKLYRALVGLCALVAVAGFFIKWKTHFAVESIPVFYAIYGFTMFTGLILLAKGLRVLIKRPEDFYGDKAVDREDYPETGTDRREHGDV